MPRLTCPLGTDCNKGEDVTTWSTLDLEFDQAKALLDMHLAHAHPSAMGPPPSSSQQPKAEKLSKPHLRVKDGLISEESWEYFNHQWSAYKKQANLQANSKEYLGVLPG